MCAWLLNQATSQPKSWRPFDEDANHWAVNLPKPQGIYGTPADKPLLDVMAGLAGEGVQKISVYAPYYDPEAAALSELSRRFSAPIKTFLQKGHVGLSEIAASRVPINTELISVETSPSRFIHAKLYGFHHPESTLIVVGSANVSRAALLADASWGNAELVAAQTLSNDQADELLADLIVLDVAPEFPKSPPSDDWEVVANPLRIVAARFANGILEVALMSQSAIAELTVEMDDGQQELCHDVNDNAVARVQLQRCPKSVQLHCKLKNGERISSEPSWVDNEGALATSTPERRIAAKMAEAAEAGALSANGMFEILQLLHQHLRHPSKPLAQHQLATSERTARTWQPYDIEDVFSDGFNRPQDSLTSKRAVGFREADFLRAFSSYFAIAGCDELNEVDPLSNIQIASDVEHIDDMQTEGIAHENIEEDFKRRQMKLKRPEEASRLRNKLMAAFENVIVAMNAEEFLSGRSPERIAADIAATALLLRKGLLDEILSEADFTSATKSLFIILFFGAKGEQSVFQRYLDKCSDDEEANFGATLASPRLTAALTLLCHSNWKSESIDAIQFKFSAMLLAARLPWVVAGGAVPEIHGELRRLSRAMPGAADFESLVAAWTAWLQAGLAFQDFERTVKEWSPKDLAALVTVDEVKPGELLWQAGQFCISAASYRRRATTKAVVHPLTKSSDLKIVGSWLVPVSALLAEDRLMGDKTNQRQTLKHILDNVDFGRPTV